MTDEGIMVQAHIDGNSELGEQWKQHSESFDNGSEALRDLLRDSFDEDGSESSRNVTRGLRAGLVTLIILFLGQAHLVYGPAVSMPLFTVSLLVFSIVLVVPDTLGEIFTRGSE